MSLDLIIQCRFQSTRLNAKILLPIGRNLNSLDILINNFRSQKKIRKIILAVPKDEYEIIFKNIAKKYNINFYSSKIDMNNVLKRFYMCAKKFKSKNIMRITSDCPFINIHMVQDMIDKFKNEKLKFLTNNFPRKIPHGFDCEIFSFDVLNNIYKKAKSKFDKEHVTSWYRKNNKSHVQQFNFYKENYSDIRLTLDYLEDYKNFLKNYNVYIKLSKLKNSEKIIKIIYNKI
jgi:spore coat polysaccharide biosynthesis protein SpsF (cytidylyltransferase family)